MMEWRQLLFVAVLWIALRVLAVALVGTALWWLIHA